ncbi:hypothetical protein B0J14DRAFT_492688, partial [Halenospora varia]
KALAKLNTIRQGARSFVDFICDFDRLLLEAGGWNWDDRVKKGYLRATVPLRLLQATISVEEKPTYIEFCS